MGPLTPKENKFQFSLTCTEVLLRKTIRGGSTKKRKDKKKDERIKRG